MEQSFFRHSDHLWEPDQLHFFLMECIKGNVYATEVQDHDDLINRIVVTATDIRGQQRKQINIRDPRQCRCEACIRA